MILGTCSGLLDVALFSPKQAVMLSINWIIDIIRCRWTKKPFTHLQEGLFYNVALSVVIFICLGRPKSGRSRIIPPKRLSWNFPPKWLSWNIPPKRLSWMGMDGPNNVYIYIYLIYIIHHPNLLTDSYIFISMSLTLDVTWYYQWKYIFNQNQKHKLFPSIFPLYETGFSTFSPWSTTHWSVIGVLLTRDVL